MVSEEEEAPDSDSEAVLLSEPRTRVSELRRDTEELRCPLATQFMRRSVAPRMSRSATRNMRMCATPCSSEA